MESPFKVCGSCRSQWADWRSFVLDPGVRLLGLQAVPGLPDANTLVFEHRCGTSVSVLTSRLRHVIGDEDRTGEASDLFGTEICHGYCRSIEELTLCDRPCVNARDRRLTVLLSEMKRDASGRASCPS